MAYLFTSDLVKKMVLLLTIVSILALVNPVIAAQNTPKSSDLDSIADPPSDGFFRKPCSKWKKDDILNVVIEHMNVSETVKKVLEKSAEFGVCVARSSFCTCLRLRLEPLFVTCVGVIGIKCMRHLVVSDPSFRCTLDCTNALSNTSYKLDNEAINSICSRSCVKKE